MTYEELLRVFLLLKIIIGNSLKQRIEVKICPAQTVEIKAYLSSVQAFHHVGLLLPLKSNYHI